MDSWYGQQQQMKIVIVLSLLALLSNCNLLPIISAAPDEDGVVKCIRDRAPELAETSPEYFCGEPIDANAECFSNFNSLNLCLLNNKCFIDIHDTSIPVACWNCWHDLPLGSDQFVQLQKDIATCSEPFVRMLVLVVLLLAAFLF